MLQLLKQLQHFKRAGKLLMPLLSRLSLGTLFMQAGWGKLQHLEKTIAFFTSLGIPFPGVQAPFVAGVELVGGILLVAGLGTRLAALPLSAILAVAILTAKRSEITSVGDLAGISEFPCLLLLLWLVLEGAGALSLDRVITRARKSS